MRTDIKEAWVAALRSGKYEQGKSFLCRNDKYCCLGVLCELPSERDLAGVIWTTSRADESTISGIGAEHVARGILDYLREKGYGA